MKKMLLLGVAAIALAAAAPAQGAGLTLTGEMGAARTPMAQALAPLTIAVAGDFVGSEDTFVPLRAEFGVISGLEIGASYWYEDTQGDPTVWGLNGKYVIPTEYVEQVNFAAGLNYQAYSADGDIDYATLKIYGVVTYTLEAAVTLIPSAGISYEIQGGDKDESGVRLFASLLTKVRPNLAIGAEFNSTNEDLDGEGADSDFWVGARFWPRENIAIQAGMINNLDIGSDDPSDFVFHLGAQYAFSIAR